ncbi:hypothetical protein KFE25_005487 [Diacronema lutheri]|uniref:Uncharacterized protein n=1 Tax=Diacronema lutheri TaxID=2081491 RepID=A0A8J5XPM7_DIALT|nr:hypothetical protein KFE25_005487 [Diacronema lutheri]
MAVGRLEWRWTLALLCCGAATCGVGEGDERLTRPARLRPPGLSAWPRANQSAPCVARAAQQRLAPRAFELPSRASLPSAGALERLPLARLLRAEKVANYTIAFASYAAGEPYLTTQQRHVQTARAVAGVDITFAWSKEQLMRTEWGQRVLRKFYRTFTKHARWVWKPYVIWHALSQLRDGDFVVYLDASRFFRKGFEHSVIPLANFLYANRRGAIDRSRLSLGMVPGIRLKERNRSHWFWPFKCQLCELLARMGLCRAPDDDACCTSYWSAPHVQASFSVWQRNPITMRFVETWLSNCEDMEVLRRSKQGDQCVSTLISIAYSRALGLKVPWIQIPGIQNGNRLKDPGLLFGRFERGELPPFLRDSDPYPECADGTADEYFMCNR